MTDILLLRHGKSDWKVDVNDFHRPLNKRGKRAAQRIGHWMQRQGYILDRVWSSPATRAVETAEKTIKALGLPVSVIEQIPNLYEASTANILDVISEARRQQGTTLIVGHNPSMEVALNVLVPDEQLEEFDTDKLMPTATLAHIHFDDEGKATLKQLIHPKTLPEQFDISTEFGLEFADRPPYYFQQSGVIPYRFHDGEWQVLLVTKSKKTKWGLPKGIVEPGLSPVESAAKEAMEEAGVLGHVEDEVLGVYQHKKWGWVCDITIYPMRVTECLGDADWESNKRNRRWISLADAAEYIENDDITAMILALASRVGTS